MIKQILRNRNLLLKKEYRSVIVCFLLDEKWHKILDKSKNQKQLYNVKWDKIYKKEFSIKMQLLTPLNYII